MRLEESPLNDTQKILPVTEHDWFQLEVEIDRNWELSWWILSNGWFIAVQEPHELREEIAQHYREGVKHYQ